MVYCQELINLEMKFALRFPVKKKHPHCIKAFTFPDNRLKVKVIVSCNIIQQEDGAKNAQNCSHISLFEEYLEYSCTV